MEYLFHKKSPFILRNSVTVYLFLLAILDCIFVGPIFVRRFHL